MGLKTEGFPDSVDRRGRQSDGFGQSAQALMRRVPRRRLQRQADDLRDFVIADLTRRARTGLVQQALHTTLREAPPPLADGVGRRADPLADVLVLHAFRRQQNDPRPLGQTLAVRRRDAKLPQFAPLAVAQIDRNRPLAIPNPPLPPSQRTAYICRSGH
jgi:hypothetical protein